MTDELTDQALDIFLESDIIQNKDYSNPLREGFFLI